MRALIKLIVLLVLLSPLALATVAWFALSDAALVTERAQLSHEDIARARRILQQNDPRNMPAGTRRAIEIDAQDLNLAANYLVQRVANGHVRLSLTPGQLDARLTLILPRLPLRKFLNVDATIQASSGQARVSRLRVGRVPVPAPLASWLARRLLAASYDQVQLDSAAGLFKELQLFHDHLRLTYQWSPALIDQARDTLLTGSDREALRFYHDHLVELQAQGIGRSGSLTGLLKPIFAAALERSEGRSPVEENVALLTVLGTWASRQDITKLVPDAAPRPQAFRLKIEGRTDFAQHFLTSAALAARGDSTLSDAVGLFKEISDSERGSGFSFTDIAADRAGTRFGALATRTPADAQRVQRRLAAGVAETDIMPPARDLPEHMRGDAFRQRFEHVGSPAYQQVMQEIERRVDACPLYRD